MDENTTPFDELPTASVAEVPLSDEEFDPLYNAFPVVVEDEIF